MRDGAPSASTSRRARGLPAVALSLVLGVAALVVAEVVARGLGLVPREWPAAEGTALFPGMRMDPLLGALLRPGWAGEWFGGFEVGADADGFRTTGYPAAAGATRRVAFLGDSCTFGWGVGSRETFVARLDARQRDTGQVRFSFLNAGFPGQSAVVGAYVLREKVLPLAPDVVVLGYTANNAFRLASTSDVERFRLFAARKLLLRSHLFQALAAWLAARRAPGVHPRDRQALMRRPLSQTRRVATADEFAAATRTMAADARARGAAVLFLIFPRASLVSAEYGHEDAARQGAKPPRSGTTATAADLGLLELSCLDIGQRDVLRTLDRERARWTPVYPDDPTLRRILHQGAVAYVQGNYVEAGRRFEEAVRRAPNSPLALYALGVARLTAGDAVGGLRHLEAADRHACNVFLHYQHRVWRVATELGVPVVDATLHFQADGGEGLFLDPAHPSIEGHRVIADAVWPALLALSPSRAGGRGGHHGRVTVSPSPSDFVRVRAPGGPLTGRTHEPG